WAASNGKTEIARALVLRRANLNIVESAQQWTPLHFAAFGNHLETAKLLLESGAQVDLLDGRGKSPLHWAIVNKHLEMAEMLLNSAVTITARFREWSLLHQEGKEGKIVTMMLLHNPGADANKKAARGAPGPPPLRGAARHNRITAAKLLIDFGADVNTKNKLG